MPACIKADVPLAPFTTLKVGGKARFLATVTSLVELQEAVQFAHETSLPLFVLGSGSNVLASDQGFAGLVLYVQLQGCEYTVTDTEVSVWVAAGENLDRVVADSVARGFWGLENLSHIPGTVGATPIQNVGAYGVEVADLITAVEVFDCLTHTVRQLSREECQFAYRDSLFKHLEGQHLIVVRVHFVLSVTPTPRLTYGDLQSLQNNPDITPQVIRDAVIAIRSKKFPDWHVIGTAGSFFKNPIIPIEQVVQLQKLYPELPVYPYSDTTSKVSLAYILDKVCGLKGFKQGNVGLFEAQALVLVAYTPATADEIDTFARLVAEKVYSITAISIEREVRMLG